MCFFKVVFCAQSRFFKSLLVGPFKERESEIIPINEIDAKNFESMVYFMYHHDFPDLSMKSVLSLLPVSEYFDVQSMREGVQVTGLMVSVLFSFLRFQGYVAKQLSIDTHNVKEIYALAKSSNFESLKTQCVEFVTENFEVIPVHDFVEFDKELVSGVMNSGLLLSDEEVIFDRIIRWGYHRLNREPLKQTKEVQIAKDDELYECISVMLPPNSLFSQRNKKTLMGRDIFHLQQLANY